MDGRNIIVVGASSGGVGALQALVKDLPPDLPASVFVVLHLSPWHRSEMPEILSRAGPLPAVHAEHNQAIQPGTIYVAPPDHHLILDEGRMQLWRGPKENFHRPAVNALFHSAAVTYGKRVVGILLTGNSEDGSAGLWWIKRFGGLAIVQENAAYPKMPNSALEYTKVDYVVPISAMPPLLKTLVNNGSRLDVEPERQQGERPWKRKRS